MEEEENFMDDENIIEEDENIIEEVDEEIEFSTEKEETTDEELSNYVKIVSGSFHCQLCPKIYQKKHITVKHLKVEHSLILQNYVYDHSNRYRKPHRNLDYKCRFCPRRYTSQRLVEKHQTVHGPNGEFVFKCSVCPQYFKQQDEVEIHQISEHETKLKCSFEGCGKQFDHPDKVANHFKYAHKNRKTTQKKYTFVCQLCGKFRKSRPCNVSTYVRNLNGKRSYGISEISSKDLTGSPKIFEMFENIKKVNKKIKNIYIEVLSL